MGKYLRLKILGFLLIFLLVAFYSPNLLLSKTTNRGNLVGFIYAKDGTTPLKEKTVTIINISTGKIYKSAKTDNYGIFKIEGIEKGLYMARISTEKRDFEVRNIIGIKPDRTAKVSFAINDVKPVGRAKVIASSDPINYNYLRLTGTPGDDSGDEPGDEPGDDPGDDPADDDKDKDRDDKDKDKDDKDKDKDDKDKDKDDDDDEPDPSPCHPKK